MIASIAARIERLADDLSPHELQTQGESFLLVDRDLDAALTQSKREILASGLTWDEKAQAMAVSIRDAVIRLAEVGSMLADRSALAHVPGQDDGVLVRIIIATLSNYGTAMKWCATAHGRPREPRFDRIHTLYRMAERFGLAHAAQPIGREGITRILTPEAHYIRTLLMPMICTGNMDRQQLEISDSWLWTWVRDYRLARHAEPGEPGLWVDIEGVESARLSHSVPRGEDVRFLVVSRMREQLAEVMSGFRVGHIYPAFGLASEFRLEAHVRVIEIVEGMWDDFESARRSGSVAIKHGGRRVEVFAGLQDVLSRAFASPGSPAPAIVAAGVPGNRGGGVATVYEIVRRWARVVEEWDSGARISVERSQWDRLSHGDLVAIRSEGDETPCIGAIERKFLSEQGGARLIVNWIGRDPRMVALRARGEDGIMGNTIDAIYFPGTDSSGQLDSLMIARSEHSRSETYDLALPDQTYQVRLNRIRIQGGGWIMAGYEIEGRRDTSFHDGGSSGAGIASAAGGHMS